MVAPSRSGSLFDPREPCLSQQGWRRGGSNRDKPAELLISLESDGLLREPGVRAALTTALFRDGELSLVRAAHGAEMEMSGFINHLGRLGIPAIRLTALETRPDLHTLEQGLQSSSPTQTPDRPGANRRAGVAAGAVQQRGRASGVKWSVRTGTSRSR